MNPDGERDYEPHVPGHYDPRIRKGNKGSDWPMSLFLIVLTLSVAAICITGLITR
jgi:hypothetical protein